MNHPCYALLDDAGDSADGADTANPTNPAKGADFIAPRSRLYTGHVATLRCDDAADWPALLNELDAALQRGQHAVTLCAYELGAVLQGIPAPAKDQRGDPRPLAEILLFAQCAHLRRDQVDAWLANACLDEAGPAGIANIQADVDKAQFTSALARIHAYIEAGDTYQVNYTYRLRFDAFGAPQALYARLRARQPVPYGALIALPDGGAILSLSPELFVRHVGGELTARPMKGTAPAAPLERDEDNAARAAALAADTKNRAENLMIVDLLRNDMGQLAVTGSVNVPALFEVRRYGSVLQMTSTVTARLREDATLSAIFAALYPCGSITGAPKRRSMEIIAELEAAARGIYTGAIGWFDAPTNGRTVGDFCLSVPIRTLALQPPVGAVRRGQLGVGAGIVHDSDAADEFAECRLKARFLTGLRHDFDLFETMYANRDGVRHQERHLRRLAASAGYFGFICDLALLRQQLAQACAALPASGPSRLRLALTQSGETSITHAPLLPLDGPVRLLLASDATNKDDLFLRHKTTERARYDAAWRHAESVGAFDTVFFNEDGALTEGGRCNVFVKRDGRWSTPPLSAGALPGVMRAVLLDDPAWAASERILTIDDLRRADDIIVCNALRGALPATVVFETTA